MPVTLINVFIVPEDKEDEFVVNWRKSAAQFQLEPGFVETHFHKNTGIGNPTFTFINIATWESPDAWRIAHEKFPPTEYAVEGVRGHPAIYEPIIDVTLDGPSPGPAGWTPRVAVNA